jgi:hypothetical protein
MSVQSCRRRRKGEVVVELSLVARRAKTKSSKAGLHPVDAWVASKKGKYATGKWSWSLLCTCCHPEYLNRRDSFELAGNAVS